MELDAEQNELNIKLPHKQISILEGPALTNSDVNISETFANEIVSESLEQPFLITKKINILYRQPIDDLVKLRPKDRDHVKIFEKIFNFIEASGKLIGIDVAYEWTPEKNILFWFVLSLMAFSWLCIFYTQANHFKNGDILRIL